jgi:hypothetical protein
MTVVPTGVVRRLGIASDSKNEIILRTPAPQVSGMAIGAIIFPRCC